MKKKMQKTPKPVEMCFFGGGEGEYDYDKTEAEKCVLHLTLDEDETFDLIADLFNALRAQRELNTTDVCVQVSLQGDIRREKTEEEVPETLAKSG